VATRGCMWNRVEPQCSVKPRRSRPRCQWKSLCVIVGATVLGALVLKVTVLGATVLKATVPVGIYVLSLEPRSSLKLRVQGCPRRCVCVTLDHEVGLAPAITKRALGIVHKPLGIYFASGGFFPPSSRKEVFLCQAARIA
jgi:hypothetical protein